jgi:hypothetical protein
MCAGYYAITLLTATVVTCLGNCYVEAGITIAAAFAGTMSCLRHNSSVQHLRVVYIM